DSEQDKPRDDTQGVAAVPLTVDSSDLHALAVAVLRDEGGEREARPAPIPRAARQAELVQFAPRVAEARGASHVVSGVADVVPQGDEYSVFAADGRCELADPSSRQRGAER